MRLNDCFALLIVKIHKKIEKLQLKIFDNASGLYNLFLNSKEISFRDCRLDPKDPLPKKRKLEFEGVSLKA